MCNAHVLQIFVVRMYVGIFEALLSNRCNTLLIEARPEDVCYK